MPRALGSHSAAATLGGNRHQVTAGQPENQVKHTTDDQAGRLMESLLLSVYQRQPSLFDENDALYLGTYEHVLTVLQFRFVVAHPEATADERLAKGGD